MNACRMRRFGLPRCQLQARNGKSASMTLDFHYRDV